MSPSLLHSPVMFSCLRKHFPSHFKNLKNRLVVYRYFHPSCKENNFWEPNKHGDEMFKKEDKLSFMDHVRRGRRFILPESKKLINEVKDHFDFDKFVALHPQENVVDKFFEFNGPESLSSWNVSSDKDFDMGYSTASVTVTPYGTGCFSGNLSTEVPKSGINKTAGFANLKFIPPTKSFERPKPYMWVLYTHLFLRVRGDGRTYMVNLHTPDHHDITWLEIFSYVLHTRGGPYWQETKIPFSKFFLNYKGRVQDKQQRVDLGNIHNFSITLMDQNTGPYRLEIDHVGCLYDPHHTEQFAYETYQTPAHYGFN